MKTIGLIGGTSWVSTIDYYRAINQLTNERLGESNFAQLILYSVNFNEFKILLDNNEWDKIAIAFSGIAKKLEAAGAECIILCANTPHRIADDVQRNIKIPLIHIAKATATEIAKNNITRVGLLGTRFVMEGAFFKDKFIHENIECLLPDEDDRAFVHDSIFKELTKDIFTEPTKQRYIKIIDALIKNGAEGIVFACTEIPILLKDKIFPVKTFDTTLIHAKAVVDFALE